MSINLSNKQLRSPENFKLISENIAKHEIEPGQLWIEISEQTGIGNEEVVLPILNTLRSLGALLCLDDFGTGYSTLTYLYRLPISVLKIDRSIIADVNINLESNRIIKTIISLARSMDMKVVAEGIETRDQLDFLIRSGCDYAQGYYFFEPLYSDQIFELFQEQV